MHTKKILKLITLYGIGFFSVFGLMANTSNFQDKLTSDFNGTYITECKKVENTGTSSLVRLIINDSKFIGLMEVFHGISCDDSNLVIKQEMFADINVIDKKGSDVVIKEDIISSSVTYLTEDYVSEANATKVFGYSDWSLGVSKDITESVKQQIKENHENSEYTFLTIKGNKLISVGYWPGMKSSDIDIDKVKIYTRLESILTQPLRSEFNGEYISSCEQVEGSHFFINKKISIEGSGAKIETSKYQGSSCIEDSLVSTKTETINVVVLGDYKGSKLVKFIKGLVEYTIFKSEYISEANDSKLYGFSNWVKGEKKDITSVSILEEKNQNDFTEYFTIYRAGSELFLSPYWFYKADTNLTKDDYGSGVTKFEELKVENDSILNEFDGVYGTKCNNKKGVFAREIIEFRNSQLTCTRIVYSSNTCSLDDILFKISTVFNYVEDGKDNDFYIIKGTLKSIEAVVFTEKEAQVWNMESSFSRNNWTKNITQDVTNVLDQGNYAYFKIKMEEDILFFDSYDSKEDLEPLSTMMLKKVE